MFDDEFKELLDEDNRDHEGLDNTGVSSENNSIGNVVKNPNNDQKAIDALKEITASYDKLAEISKNSENKEQK